MQYVVNGLLSGAGYALVAISFAVIFRTVRFFNFTHAATYTIAAYVAFTVWRISGPVLGLVSGIICGVALGVTLHWLVFRPLAKRRTSPLALLLVSLGIYVALQNGVSMVWTDTPLTVSVPSGLSRILQAWGTRITTLRGGTFAAACLALGSLWLWLTRTTEGVRLRAVANDRTLGLLSGLNPDRYEVLAYVVGSSTVALAGILAGLDGHLVPTMGFNALLMGVAAMLVGGSRSLLGAGVAAFMLGVIEQSSVAFIPSKWMSSVAFMLLALILLFKPSGLSGSLDVATGNGR